MSISDVIEKYRGCDLIPQPGQRGLTFKATFIKEIEEFIDRHPELGWAAVPEAIRYAWNKFVAEYKEKIMKN